MSGQYVYFAQSFDGGPIKIGLSKNPKGRIAHLAIGSPVPLEIVAVIPGNDDTESLLHDLFADHRLHGEWFSEDAPGLAHLIEALINPDLTDECQLEMKILIDRIEEHRAAQRAAA